MAKVCLARLRPPSLHPHPTALQRQNPRLRQNLRRSSHLLYLAQVQMAFPVRAKQVHAIA